MAAETGEAIFPKGSRRADAARRLPGLGHERQPSCHVRTGCGPRAMPVADTAMSIQQSVRGTLAIAAVRTEADVKPPAITVIGAVAGFSQTPPARESAERPTS